jgi:hypothetical protein
MPSNMKHHLFNQTEKNYVIHLRDHINITAKAHSHAPISFPLDIDDDIDINSLKTGKPMTEDAPIDLRSEKPITLYIWRQQTGPNKRVMNVLPALTAMKNNEICVISKGNQHRIFGIAEKGGINALHFTRTVNKRGNYLIELICTPIHNQSKVTEEYITLLPFTINLELHLL